MNKILFWIGLSCCSISINAQVTDFMPGSNAVLEYVIVNDIDKELNGSAFYEEKFEPGTIIENGGRSFRAYLRYNAMKDYVEIKVLPLDPDIYVLPRSERFSYKLADYTYILLNETTDKGEIFDTFLQNYISGNYASFIGKPNLKIVKDRNEKSALIESKPTSIKINFDYYLKVNGGKFQEVRLKEKDFMNIIPHSKEMKEYFDNHKVNDVEDVVKMLKYYESTI